MTDQPMDASPSSLSQPGNSPHAAESAFARIAEMVERAPEYPVSPDDDLPHEGSEGHDPGHDSGDGGGGYDDGDRGEHPEDPEAPVLARCASEAQNDTGNARRFRHRYGDLAGDAQGVVHVQNIGWFCWDEKRWKEDIDHQGVRPLAQRTAELIAFEAKLIQPSKEESETINAGVEAMLDLDAVEAELAGLEEADEDAEGDEGKADLAVSREERRKKKRALGQRKQALDRVVKAAERVEKRIQARRTDRRRHGNSSGNKGKLDGMLNEAVPYLSRAIRDFDTAELDLNVENGTLYFDVKERRVEDLECPDPDVKRYTTERTVNLGIRPHSRADFNTKLCPVFWCQEAKAPTFSAFLQRVMPNEALRAYLQRFFGYCLTRRTSEQVFCIFHGGGRNGKSTLVDIIARVLDDYATTVPVASLMAENARKAQDATPDLNRLPGARFVRTSEPKEGLAINEGLVKELTGGEPINLRRLNQESIEVYPEFKLVISCNSKPRILGNDEGIWRRIALVPFDVQIPKDEVDKALPDKLWAERAGVLAWMVEGARQYLALGGLKPPKEIIDATNEYRLAEDPVGKFIMAALKVTRDPHDVIESGRLYEGYIAWAKRFSEPLLGSATFSRKMPKAAEDNGFIKGKSSVSVYVGISFKDGFAPPDGPSHTRYDDKRL